MNYGNAKDRKKGQATVSRVLNQSATLSVGEDTRSRDSSHAEDFCIPQSCKQGLNQIFIKSGFWMVHARRN